MDDKIIEIIANVFGVSPTVLTKGDSPDTLPEWTSIKHMNLTLALEQELNITLSQKDIIEMLSVELILTIVKEKL